MQYIAIGAFGMDAKTLSEIASRRKDYKYPSAWSKVQSFMDVQGRRVITLFETDDAASILGYASSFPEVEFDIFPVVPTDRAWETYLNRHQ